MAAVVMAGVAAVAGAAERFDLRIDDVSGLTEPWPMMGGLPFAPGMIADAEQIRMLRDGTPVPAQIDVVARWQDGSIRWALAGFTEVPQGSYAVEFGDGVRPVVAPQPLRVEQSADGRLLIDTGVAQYTFTQRGLLPETAVVDGSPLISGGAHGAYLVDNHKRLSRVAGEKAAITTEILKDGPLRTVIRRDGWYVTAAGERIARARAWFYFAAGTPVVRITHSLIFTEDTNEVWVRDYGLEFLTGKTPRTVLFSMEEGDEAVLVEATPAAGEEVYLLQDTFPHFLERESLGVVGRSKIEDGQRFDQTLVLDNDFWTDDWSHKGEVAGDWADVNYGDVRLTVVMPHLARRFPKEIAVGADGCRVAFWSGRSGRELDFRAVTLVNEYWQSFANGAPGGALQLAAQPSNAQGTGRSHDVWLIPAAGDSSTEGVRQRARAARDMPLVQADRVWLSATEAIGWPMHPVDEENFADQEALIRNYWNRLERGREQRFFNGFIDFGRHSTIRGPTQFFRLAHLVDYGLRTHVWTLYGRSGDRSYYDYATHFNRFAGDWELANWDAGEKFAGGLTLTRDISNPFYWGERSSLISGVTGDDMGNWILEYYMTGDEYAANRIEMIAQAFRDRFDPAEIPAILQRVDSSFAYVRRMAQLYQWDGDPQWVEWGTEWLNHLIDFNEPNSITDKLRYGALYKTDRNLLYLYQYYKATGDETARLAILQALDYKYRFARPRQAFAGQAYPALLYSMAYRWTGNPNYLRLANYIVETGNAPAEDGPHSIHSNMHPTMALPWALTLLAEIDGPIDPFPVVTQFREPEPTVILFRKKGSQPVEFSMRLYMDEENLEPEPQVFTWVDGARGQPVGGLEMQTQFALQPSAGNRADATAWHVFLTVPAAAAEGLYALEFPRAERVDVLESSAAETAVYAPQGFRVRGDNVADYFVVKEGTERVRLFLGYPMTVRRADGSIAVEASQDNIGELVIPTGGSSGVWSVTSSQSAIVQLFTGEPVFSRSPQWLVTGANVEAPARFEAPSEELEFVDGLAGQALHVPEGTILAFPRGPAVDGHYAYFAGSEGTIEFWFRPNWSTANLAYTMGSRFNDHYFLRSGSHALQYRRGQVRANAPEFAAVNLWAYGTESNAGFSGRFVFEAGEWYHIAVTWRTVDGVPGNEGEYALFINGEEVERTHYRSAPTFWPGGLTGNVLFTRKEADERVLIGPINGTISGIRVSDIIRYSTPFDPAVTPGRVDSNTRILFPLDGNWTGTSADGSSIELKPR